MNQVDKFFDEWGMLALFGAAFTPIPFKAFTISSGIGGMSLPLVLLSSLVGRSLRFFLMAALIFFLGSRVKTWIDKYFGLLTLALLALLVGGFACLKFLV